MSVIDQVKARLDIVEVISGYVSVKRAGRNYKALCPFHHEKTPSFVIFPESQSWRCFGQCGTGGDVFNFVMRQHGWEFDEALRELAAKAGVDLDDYKGNQAQESADQRLYAILNETAAFFHQQLPNSPAEAYLHIRGLSAETAQLFGLGYAPAGWRALLDHLLMIGYSREDMLEAGVIVQTDDGKVFDRFRQRFMIPIRDSRGRTVGFGARALQEDQQPKYLNSPQGALFDKSHLLYGFDMARRPIREQETAVIVEGYLDVIQAHQAGFHNVVATMGTALTEHHMRELSKHAHRLVLALDADAAGIKATMRGLDVARETLGDGSTVVMDAKGVMKQAGRLKLDVRVLEIPQGKDPDDFIRHTPEQWQPQIDNALPLPEFLIKTATQDLTPNASVTERELIAHDLLPLLMATEDNLQQRTNIQLLSLRLHLDEKAMLQWSQQHIRQLAPPSGKRPPAATPPRPPKTTTAPRGMALENYCLSVLLRAPQRLSEANRLLRGLAQQEEDAIAEPLNEGDFIQTPLQMIFQHLQAACRQDDLEPLDYLLNCVDVPLRQVIDDLLPEPLEVYIQHVHQLHVTELHSIRREQQRLPRKEPDDFLMRVLTLRRERIVRESKEYYYLLSETDHAEIQEAHTARYHRLLRTTRTIDLAIRELQET